MKNISTILASLYLLPILAMVMLGKIPVVWKRDGKEPFVINGKTLPIALQDFRWRWFSNLATNNLRWILAEYIVATALWVDQKPREERDSFDLITSQGLKIEVKSASYIQSREQNKLSAISFSIRPTQWRDTENRREEHKQRQSDVYIFCLLAHQEQETLNPLDLAQWLFYIVPTEILNEQCEGQKTLSLNRLQKMWFTPTQYDNIAESMNKITK